MFLFTHDCHMTGFAGNVTSVGFMDVRLEDDPALIEDDNELGFYDNRPIFASYMSRLSECRKELAKQRNSARNELKIDSKVNDDPISIGALLSLSGRYPLSGYLFIGTPLYQDTTLSIGTPFSIRTPLYQDPTLFIGTLVSLLGHLSLSGRYSFYWDTTLSIGTLLSLSGHYSLSIRTPLICQSISF